MLRNVENTVVHPFWYAKVLAVLHVDVKVTSNSAQNPHAMDVSTHRVEMLWVWWLGGIRWGGWAKNRLDLVGYIDDGTQSGSFGLIDPAMAVRSPLLIPASEYGQTKTLLNESCAWDDQEEGDWVAYYIMR
jgi:hypothetical protein